MIHATQITRQVSLLGFIVWEQGRKLLNKFLLQSIVLDYTHIQYKMSIIPYTRIQLCTLICIIVHNIYMHVIPVRTWQISQLLPSVLHRLWNPPQCKGAISLPLCGSLCSAPWLRCDYPPELSSIYTVFYTAYAHRYVWFIPQKTSL